MLWNAGQERVTRERRERLATLYQAGRDGYIAAQIAMGRAKTKGDPRPSYIRTEGTPSRGDVGTERATLARLAARFPGHVRVN